MSSKAGERLVPELRFPEFRNSGHWGEKQLYDVALFVNEKVALENLSPERYVSTENLLQDFMGMVPSPTRPSIGSATRFKMNDVLISNIRPYLKKIWVAEIEGGASNDVIVIRTRKDVANKYLSQLLKSDRFVEYVMTGAKGVKMPRGDIDLIKKFVVAVPTKPDEQKKIADCLSSVDNLIAAQTQKIEALKAHKKGLMQQLFPAEGETVPRLRFPEFRDAGEWKEKKAGTLFVNRIEEGEAGLPIYSVTMNDGMIKRSLLDRDFDDIAEPGGNKKAHNHDIAYNMMRMWQGASGVAVEDCMVSPAYVILVPQNGIHSIFFGYLFKLSRYLRMLASHSQGITSDRLRLYYKDFANILLPHPVVPEQKKIADCLSSLDKLITAHTQKLEALRVHKKGLMQGLFPSTAEGGA